VRAGELVFTVRGDRVTQCDEQSRWLEENDIMPITHTAGIAALMAVAATGALPVAKANAAADTAACAVSARACVKLSSQQAWLLRDGNVSYGPVPVATGQPSAPTEPGTFKVYWKDRHHRSSLFQNAPMPYAVFFDGDNAFHEDNVRVPSHGCVHLTHDAARTFYNTLHLGDEVQVVP
jgi:L,D-transpeptidase catalytic domain